jgi:hypothetical protein
MRESGKSKAHANAYERYRAGRRYLHATACRALSDPAQTQIAPDAARADTRRLPVQWSVDGSGKPARRAPGPRSET